MPKAGVKDRQRPYFRPAVERIGQAGKPAVAPEKWIDRRQDARAETIDPIPCKRNGSQRGRATERKTDRRFGKFIPFGNAAAQVPQRPRGPVRTVIVGIVDHVTREP